MPEDAIQSFARRAGRTEVIMAMRPSLRRRRQEYAPWLEAVLFAPVLGLLVLGALEVRHALDVETRLRSDVARAVTNSGPTIRVPYSQAGSVLAFLWPSAEVSASAPSVH